MILAKNALVVIQFISTGIALMTIDKPRPPIGVYRFLFHVIISVALYYYAGIYGRIE